MPKKERIHHSDILKRKWFCHFDTLRKMWFRHFGQLRISEWPNNFANPTSWLNGALTTSASRGKSDFVPSTSRGKREFSNPMRLEQLQIFHIPMWDQFRHSCIQKYRILSWENFCHCCHSNLSKTNQKTHCKSKPNRYLNIIHHNCLKRLQISLMCSKYSLKSYRKHNNYHTVIIYRTNKSHLGTNENKQSFSPDIPGMQFRWSTQLSPITIAKWRIWEVAKIYSESKRHKAFKYNSSKCISI